VQDKDEPLATKGLRAAYAMQGNNEPLTTIGDWAKTFDDCEGNKAPTVKLISPIAIPHHCNEAPCTCNETGLSATAIATDASIKDLCVVFAGGNVGLHHVTINVVDCRSDNKNMCPHITKQNVWIMPTISTTLGRHPSAMRQTPGQ
jgi:hypothetical protein